MVDQEMFDSEMVDPEIDLVSMDIDPLVLDTDPVVMETDMDIDPVVEDYGRYMGVEDYGRLISSDVFSSRFWGSQYMTPAGDQFPLDSCVSFTLSAALGALAGLTYDIQVAPEFSTQEMVDCLPIEPGGVSYGAGYNYVWREGLHTKEVYPYLYKYGSPCRCPDLQGLPKYSYQGYTWFHPADSARVLLYSHPLTAGIHIYESFLWRTTEYVSANDLMGVYSPLEGEEPIRVKGEVAAHAILVIGYGIENGEFFYIIKNWWGVGWGVNGYARVAAHLLFDFAFPNSFRRIPAVGEVEPQFI